MIGIRLDSLKTDAALAQLLVQRGPMLYPEDRCALEVALNVVRKMTKWGGDSK